MQQDTAINGCRLEPRVKRSLAAFKLSSHYARWIEAVLRAGLFVVLGAAGVGKLIDPAPAAAFLNSLMYLQSTLIVQLLGAFEIVIGLWLITGSAIGAAAFIATALFTIFGVSHVFVGQPVESVGCGCLPGAAANSLSSEGWIAVNCACAAAGGLLLLKNEGRRRRTRCEAA